MATALEAALTGAARREQRPAAPLVEEIPVDSNRLDCLVENSGLDVAPRWVENPIKQG
jgi:hypothetical protein